MIREEKKTEVEEEIRRQVDNLMREELDLLKAVMILMNIFYYIINDSWLKGCGKRQRKERKNQQKAQEGEKRK